jgi:hypothetical protein
VAQRIARGLVRAHQRQDHVAHEIAELRRAAIDLRIGQQRRQVRAGLVAPRLEQALHQGKEAAQHVRHLLRALAEFGVVLADKGIGPVIEIVPADLGRQVEQLAQRHQRQRRRQRLDQVHRLARGMASSSARQRCVMRSSIPARRPGATAGIMILRYCVCTGGSTEMNGMPIALSPPRSGPLHSR